MFTYLFLGGSAPPPPYGDLTNCGSDPTPDDLTCEAYPLCH
jgi:hypothetical protein